MSRANAVSKGTFYRGPEFKNPSGGTPKKSSYKKKQFSFLASASFEAISNLHSTISDLKCQIASLNKENKTLKMVTSKQERAIMQMDKDNQDYPHLMKVMAEELRVLKSEKRHYSDKSVSLERTSKSQSEEMLKLQDKIKSLILRLKSQEHQDISSLQKIVEKSTLQIEALELEKLQLGKQCRNYELEKNREILFAKHQVQKFTQNLVSSKDEVSKLQIRLKERERSFNTIAMYTSGMPSELSLSTSKRPIKLSKLPEYLPIQEDNVPAGTPVVEIKLNESVVSQSNQTSDISRKPNLEDNPKSNSVFSNRNQNHSYVDPAPSPAKSTIYKPDMKIIRKFKIDLTPNDSASQAGETGQVPQLDRNEIKSSGMIKSNYSNDFE